jgi:4'-phosphopantetheinyl transferase
MQSVQDKLLNETVKCTIVDIVNKSSTPSCLFPCLSQNNIIHIYSASYRDLDQHYNFLSEVISVKEQQTASLFRNVSDTRKYILTHGLLRTILCRYLNLDPREISFITGEKGKPEVDLRNCTVDVSFNLSHTSEIVIFGFVRNMRIGIDIIKMDPGYQYHDIADYILTPAENEFMQGMEPELKRQLFFRVWALKEAILKTNGDTISRMKNIDTSDILEKDFSFPCYSKKYQTLASPLFIYQFNCGKYDYGVVAVEMSTH